MTQPFPAAIDLFAGCGGLSLGLHRAGWDVIGAVERSPMAADTYYANFIAQSSDTDSAYESHRLLSPAAQLQAGLLVGGVEDVPRHLGIVKDLLGNRELGLLAGGPPCQGFSLAGRRAPDDERNKLVWKFFELVTLLHPVFVVLENVPAIRSSFERGSKANVLADLETALERSGSNGHQGYAVTRLLLRADHYGVPQRRKRVFLIGVRGDVADELGITGREAWDSEAQQFSGVRPLVAPDPDYSDRVTVRDALWDLTTQAYAPMSKAPGERARRYVSEMRTSEIAAPPVGSSSRSAVAGNAPPNHKFRNHTERTATRFRLLRLFQQHGVSNDLFAAAAQSGRGIEPELGVLEGLMPLDLPLGTVRSVRELAAVVRRLPSKKHSQRALDPDAPSPTVTTLPDDLAHYAVNRTLTIREMARLQSFPDSFLFKGKETTGGEKRRVEVPQYSQVGNAVPPLLAEAVGRRLFDLLAEVSGSHFQPHIGSEARGTQGSGVSARGK